jgi:hypothetical protein
MHHLAAPDAITVLSHLIGARARMPSVWAPKPSAMPPFRKFILGEPIKPATKRDLRLLVELQRRAHLLDHGHPAARRCGRPASSPPPGRESHRSWSTGSSRGEAWRSRDGSPRAVPRRGSKAARRTGIHFGIAHDGPADGNALALAARQLLGQAVQIILDLQHVGRLLHPLLDASLRVVGASGRRPCSRRRSCAGRARRTGTPWRCRAWTAPAPLTTLPSNNISPEVMSSRPAIRRSSVDLPAARRADEDHELALANVSRSTPLITSTGGRRTCGCL